MSDAQRPLKPGDKVRLKSGGPQMTVRKIRTIDGEINAECHWADDKKLPRKADYLPEMLELEEDD